MHFSLKSVYYQNITKILKINLFFIGFEKIYKFFVLRFAENLPVTFKKKKFLPRIYRKMIVTKKGWPLILIDKLKRRIVALQGGKKYIRKGMEVSSRDRSRRRNCFIRS